MLEIIYTASLVVITVLVGGHMITRKDGEIEHLHINEKEGFH